MTESMIERATLAVVEIWQKSNNPPGSVLDCRAVAEAVIRTMREPTELMIEAGLAAKVRGAKTMQDVLEYDNEGGALEIVFPAMIDAALKWPPGSADRAGVPLAKD